EGRALRSVHIRAEGDRIVVGDGSASFDPESGQALFDFGAGELADKIKPLLREPDRASADDWYQRGCDLEEIDAEAAREAYQKAVAIDGAHGDAHVNLGRLWHEAGDARKAADHYRRA